MKTETGYTYEIDGQVVVNSELMPDGYLFTNNAIGYKRVLAKWKANCIPAVNAQYKRIIFGGKKWLIIDCGKNEIPIISNFTDGQKVQHIEGKVIKLL